LSINAWKANEKAIFLLLFAVATTTLVLRLYVRRFMTIHRFELDDYIIMVSWVPSQLSGADVF
jgi:hypothetical protein